MALADHAANPPKAKAAGVPCSIGHLYTLLADDAKELAALDQLLYGLGLNATQVYEALEAEGYEVGRQSINRHRGRKCGCYKAGAA